MNSLQLSKYRGGIQKISQFCAQEIRQLGRRGLGELVRPLLAILCNSHRDRLLRIPIDTAVHDIPKIIDYRLFQAIPIFSRRIVFYDWSDFPELPVDVFGGYRTPSLWLSLLVPLRGSNWLLKVPVQGPKAI